jgi:hypothetical protein
MVLIFSALGYPGSLGLAASLIGRVKQYTWVALGLCLGWVMAFKQSNVKPQSLKLPKKLNLKMHLAKPLGHVHAHREYDLKML